MIAKDRGRHTMATVHVLLLKEKTPAWGEGTHVFGERVLPTKYRSGDVSRSHEVCDEWMILYDEISSLSYTSQQ